MIKICPTWNLKLRKHTVFLFPAVTYPLQALIPAEIPSKGVTVKHTLCVKQDKGIHVKTNERKIPSHVP
jgi:hypothetical protein